MGILNITPDSFFSKSRFPEIGDVLRQAGAMQDQGAFCLDIGGYSTRPGAAVVSEQEELRRVIPAITAIRKEFPELILSVDTFRSSVAVAAAEVGADILNDVSGGTLDSEMFQVVSKLKLPYILMHMRGDPSTMSTHAVYGNLVEEVRSELQARMAHLLKLGAKDIIIDPGFGFAKTPSHNFELMRSLSQFSCFNRPLLVGISRKSFIWKTLNTDPEGALNGTTALNTAALIMGASMLRVHDVREAVEAVNLLKHEVVDSHKSIGNQYRDKSNW